MQKISDEIAEILNKLPISDLIGMYEHGLRYEVNDGKIRDIILSEAD